MRHHAHAVFGFALIGVVAAGCLIGPQAVVSAQARVGQSHVVAHQPLQVRHDDGAVKSGLKPEVEALIKASTAEYKNLKSYQHTAEFVVKSDHENASKEIIYTLAIERPNRFCYKSDDSTSVAAICDGKVFYNLRSSKQYMRSLAPASYKDLNIVDDVTFEPIATYIVALMVQGDVLADSDVKMALAKAAVPGTVTEDGKKYNTLVVQIGANSPPTTLYFDAQTHQLHKAVTINDTDKIRTTEVIESVKLNTPIAPAMFQYTPPKDALLLTRANGPSDRLHGHSITVRL